MKIKTIILLCLLTQVLQNHGLVQLKKSLSTSDSPLLMKILQSVDAATSDEHLLDVTIKLLKSLCVCMRETLRAKEEKFTEDNSLLELGESSSTDWKVLELYRKIYNNTCFNLKQELINRTHQSKVDEETFLNHSNCGKDERNNTHDTPVASDKPELIEENVFMSKLQGILFKTLIQTKDLHKYNLKRYNLYGKGNPHTRSTLKHNIIVILTLHPDSKETPSRKSIVPEEDINETLHTNSPIDIDIIDTKYDKREDDITKPETLSECNLQSLYNFLAVSDKQNLTKVFKYIRKRDYVKIYIEIHTGPNHTDYINVCCDNGTIIPQCNKDLMNNSEVDTKAIPGMKNDTKTAQKKLVHSYRNTITKIKHLVNLYENTKLRPGEGDTNATDEGHDHDENINSQTQSSTQQSQMKNNENDINKLVSYSDDPLKLGEVTRAILLLNNFVSKRTTKKYVSMDQDYTTERNRIYSDDPWQNMVSKHFQGQDVTTSIFSYYTDPEVIGSDLKKYTEELEYLLKPTKPEWLTEINESTVTNFPSVMFTPEALKQESLLPSIMNQDNVYNNAITIDSTITDKDVVKNTNPFITDIQNMTTATKSEKTMTTFSPLLDTNEVNITETTQIHEPNLKLQFDYMQDKQNTIDYELNEISQTPQLITSNLDINSGAENHNSTELVTKDSSVTVSTLVKFKHVLSKEINVPTQFIKASEETHLTSENVVLFTTINSETPQSQSTEQKINNKNLPSKLTFNETDVKVNLSRSLIPKLLKEPAIRNSISNEIDPVAIYNDVMKHSKTKINTTQTKVLDNFLKNTKPIVRSNATTIEYYQGSMYVTETTTRGLIDDSTIIPPAQNNDKTNSVKSDIFKTHKIFAEGKNTSRYFKEKDIPYLTTTANRSKENDVNQIEAYNDVTSDVLIDFIDKVKPYNDYDNNVTKSNIFKTINAIGLETIKNQNSKTSTPINFIIKSQSPNSIELSIKEHNKDIITNNFLPISKPIRKELKTQAKSFSLYNRTDIEKTPKRENIESISSRAKTELSKTLVKEPLVKKNDKKGGSKHTEENIDGKMASPLNTAINENILFDNKQINSLLFTKNNTKSNQTIQLNSNPISILDIEVPKIHKLSETIAMDDKMSDKALNKNSELEIMKNESNTSAVDHKTEGIKLTSNSYQTKTEKFNIKEINNTIFLDNNSTKQHSTKYSDVNFNKHNTEPTKIIEAAEVLKALKNYDVYKHPKNISPIRKIGASYDIDALQRYTAQIDNVQAMNNGGLAANLTLPSEIHETIKSNVNRSEFYSKLGINAQHDLNNTKSFDIFKSKSWQDGEILNVPKTVDGAENLSMRPYKENSDISIKNNILNKYAPRYAVERMVNYNFVTSVNSREEKLSNIDTVKSFTKTSSISNKNRNMTDIVQLELEGNDLDRKKTQNETLETLISNDNVTNAAVTKIKRRSRTNLLPTNILSPTSEHEPLMEQFVEIEGITTTKKLKSANLVEDTSPVLSAPFLQTKRFQSSKINEFATYATPMAGKSNTQNLSDYVKASESNIYVNTEIRSNFQINTSTTNDIATTNLSVPNIMNTIKRYETTHTNDDFTKELINVMQIRDWTASTTQLLKPASSVSTHATLKTDSIALNNTKNRQSILDTNSPQILNKLNFGTVTDQYTLRDTLAATELYLHTNVPYASSTQVVNHIENNENTKSLINMEQTDKYAVLNPKQVFTNSEKQFLKTNEYNSNKPDNINFENSSTDNVPVKSQLLTDKIDEQNIEKSETLFKNTLITLQPTPGTEVNTIVVKNTESFTGARKVDSVTEKNDFKHIKSLKSKNPVAFELSIKVGVEASKNGIQFSVMEETQNLKNMSDKNIQTLPNTVPSQVSLNPLQKTPAVDENSEEIPISAFDLDKLIEIIDSKIPQANDSSFSNTNITRKSNVFKNEGDYLNEMFSMIDKPSFKAETIIKPPKVETVTVTNKQLDETIIHQKKDNKHQNNATTVKTSAVENYVRKVKHKSMIPGILTQKVGFDKMKVMYKQRIQEFKDSLKNKNVSVQNILSKTQETKQTTKLNENIKFHKYSMLNATLDNSTDNDLSLEIFDDSVSTQKPNKTKVRNKKIKKILNKLIKGRKLSKIQLKKISKLLKKNDTSTKKQRKGFRKKEDPLNKSIENLTVMPLTSEHGILDITQNRTTTVTLNSVKRFSNNATFADVNSKPQLIVQIEKPATKIPDVFHTDSIQNRRIGTPHGDDYVQHELKQGSYEFTSRLTSQNLATEPRPALDETLNGIPKATSTFTRQRKSDAYNQSANYLELTTPNNSTTKNLLSGMKFDDIKEVENSFDYPENVSRSDVSGTFITNMQTGQDNFLNTSTVSNDTRRKSHFTAYISERKTVKDSILISSKNNGVVRNTIFDKETLLTNKHKHSGKKEKKLPHITINISVPFSAMNTDLHVKSNVSSMLTRNVVSDYLGNNYTLQDHTVDENKLNNYNASKHLIINKHVKHTLNENTKTSITVSSTPNYSDITFISDRNSSINDSDGNQSLRTAYPDDLKQESVILEEILKNINDVQDNVDKLILTLNDTTAIKLYLNKTTPYINSNVTKLKNEQYDNISTPAPWISNQTEISSHISDIRQLFNGNFNITQLNSKITNELIRKTFMSKSTAKIESDFVEPNNMQTTPILPDASTNIQNKDGLGLAEILDTINYVQDNVDDFILTINDTDITKKYVNKNRSTTVGNFAQYKVTESKPSVRRYVLPAIRLKNITKPLFHKITNSMNTTDFSPTLGNRYNSEAELLDELEDIMVQDTFYTTPPYANINLSATNTVPTNFNYMAAITEKSSATKTSLTNSTAITPNYESNKALMGIPFSLNESVLKYTEGNKLVKNNKDFKIITTIPQRINTSLLNVAEDLNKGLVKSDLSKVLNKASIKLYNHTLHHSENLGTVMKEAQLSSTTAVENIFQEQYNLNEDKTTSILHEITTNLNYVKTKSTDQFNEDIKTNELSKTTDIPREPISKINNIFNNFTVKNSKNLENINKSISVSNAFPTKMKYRKNNFTEQFVKNKTTQNHKTQTKSDSHNFLSEPISIGKYLQINQLTTKASKLLTEESKWVLYKENLLYNELNTKTKLQSTRKIPEAATMSSHDIHYTTQQYNDATSPNSKIQTTSYQNEIYVSKPISIGKYLQSNVKTTEGSTTLNKESVSVGNKKNLFGSKNTTTKAMQNVTYLNDATTKTNNIANTFKSKYHEHATSQNPNSQIVSVYDDDHFISEPISIGKYLHINEKTTEGSTTLEEETMSVHNYDTVIDPGLTTIEQETIDVNEETTKSNYLNANTNLINLYDNITMKNPKNRTIPDHYEGHFVSEPISIGKYLQINEMPTESLIKSAEETRTISYKENIMDNPSITQTSVSHENLTIMPQNNSAIVVDITSSLSPLAIKDDETNPKLPNTFTPTKKTFGDVISQLYYTQSTRMTTRNKFTTVPTSSLYLNDLNHKNGKHQTPLTVNATDVTNLYDNKQVTVYDARTKNPFSTPSNSSAEEITPVPTKVWSNTSTSYDKGLIIPIEAIEDAGNPIYTSDLETFKEQSYDKFSDYTDTSNETQNKIISNEPNSKEEIPSNVLIIGTVLTKNTSEKSVLKIITGTEQVVVSIKPSTKPYLQPNVNTYTNNSEQITLPSVTTLADLKNATIIFDRTINTSTHLATGNGTKSLNLANTTNQTVDKPNHSEIGSLLSPLILTAEEKDALHFEELLNNDDALIHIPTTPDVPYTNTITNSPFLGLSINSYTLPAKGANQRYQERDIPKYELKQEINKTLSVIPYEKNNITIHNVISYMKNKKLAHTSKNLVTELPIDHSTTIITSNQEILTSTPSIVSKSLPHIFTPAVTMPTLINYDSDKIFDLISANEKDIDDLNQYFNKTDTNKFEENTYPNQTHSIDSPDKENITEEQNYANIDISFFTFFQSTSTTGFDVNSTTSSVPNLNKFAKISDDNAYTTTISSPEVQIENVNIYLPPSVTYKADITMKIPIKDNYTNSLDEKIYTENNLEQDKYSQKKALGLPSFQDIATIRDPIHEHNNEKYTSEMKTYPDRVTMDPAKTIVNSYIEELSDELFQNKKINVENQSFNISTEHNQNYQPEFKGITKASSIKTNAKSDIFSLHTTNSPPDKQGIDVTTSTTSVQKTSIIPIKLKAIDTTFLGSKIYILDPYTMQNILNRGIEKNKKNVNLSMGNIFTKNNTLFNYNNNRSSTENTVSAEAVTSSSHDIFTTKSFLPVKKQINKLTNSIELSDAKNKLELENIKHKYTEGTTHRTNVNLNPKSTTNSNTEHNRLDSYNVTERVISIEDRCGSYNTLKENSSSDSKEIICKNNKTNINFVIKLGTAKKNISYIHTPKLSKIKVTKLRPVNTTKINMNLDKNQNHLHGATSKLIEVKSGTKFVKKVEDTYNSNFQELLRNVQNGRLRGENDMNIFSSRMLRPDTIRASPAAVTKNIRYNTYQPTTKEDLELLKFDSKPIFNTLLYKKIDEKPHYQPQEHNNSCIVIKSLKKTFHSKNEFITVLKAANCSEETLRHNQTNKKTLLASEGLKHSSSQKELTKNTRLTTETTRNAHTNGTLMSLIMELNKNFPDETVNKHQITREINRKPPLLDFYKNLQSKLVIGTKLPKKNNALSIGADYNRDTPSFTGINQNSPLWSNSNQNSLKSVEIHSNPTNYLPRLRTVLDHNKDLLSKLKFNKNLPSRNFPSFSDNSFEVIKDTALPKDSKKYSDPIFDTPSNIFPDTEDTKNLLSIMDFNISESPIKKENMISHSVFDTSGNPKQTIDIHKISIPTKTKYLNGIRVFPHKQDSDELFPMTELNVSTTSFKDNANTLSSSGILRNSQPALEPSRKLHPTQDENTNFEAQVEGGGHILFPMVDFNANSTLIKHQDSKYSYRPYGLIRKFQHSIEVNKDVGPSNNYNVNLLPQKGDDRNLLPLFNLNATQIKRNLETDYNVPIGLPKTSQQTHGTKKKSDPNEVANKTYFLKNEDNIILLPSMDFNGSATSVRHINTNSQTSLGFQGNPHQTGGINTDLVQNNEEIKSYFSQNEKGDNLSPVVVSVTPTQDSINNSQPPFGYIQTSHQTLGINRNFDLQKEETKNIHPFNEFVRNTQHLVESKRNFLPNKDFNTMFFTHKEASRDWLPTMEFNVSVSPNPHVQNAKQTVEVNKILPPKKEVKSNAYTRLEDNRNVLSMVEFNVSTVPINDTITNSHKTLGFLKNGKQSLEIHKTLLPNMEVNSNVFTHKEDNRNIPIDKKLHRPTGFIESVKQTDKKNRTLLTKKEVNNNVFSHKADNGSLLALNKGPAKGLNTKPHVPLGHLSATQKHIESNKKSSLIDINRNLHKSIVTKKFKKMSFNKDSLLNPFEKFNPHSVKVSPPPKVQKKSIKRMKLGNRRMEVMTMNTQDFFSQHRLVTRRNMLKNIFQNRPAINKLVTSIPRHSILRPKFGTIDKLTNRFEHKVRPKPLIMKHTENMFRDQMMHHHPDIEKRHKTPNPDKIIVQKIGLISRKSKINNVIDRPLWHPTEKPKFFKDRIDSIRNYLYNADNVKTTRPTALLHHEADDPESVEHERRPPPPARLNRRNDVEMSTTQVTDWWLDDMYLKVRLPLPINSNPGMVFPRRHFAKMEEVADLGALFIDDLLDYKEMLDRGELPLERATSREKGQPLCMEQFYRLLGVCRIPEVGRDRLELPRTPAAAEECEELVVVACRNYFYPIPVKAADRGRLTPGEMQAQLLHAMVDAAGAPPAPRVGLLTSMNRDQWARAREQLIKDEMNRMNMELISRALCIVCLDEAGGDRADADADTNAMLRAMHGAGTRHHSANRWFDKTVQLIISSDGTIGMCYEHSAAEGVAVVRLAERALARAEVADRPAPPPALLPAPLAMKWNVTNDVQRTIEQAARELDRAISDLDHKVYTYRGYGREYMKSCRTSPDVYIQLALQYAYYKMYGYLVTTYESASLRRFRNGRVDNIRSAHGAALAWAAAMCTAETPPLSDTADDGQKKVSFNLYGEQKKLELFEEAARKQTSIMEANILGKGLDNHLLGLREAARETLGELPPVFSDTTYKQMIEFKLSTSQVSTTTDGTFMGYGAVCPDGYGCSYNPKKDSIIFCISSFTSSSVTNTEAFRQSLEEALDSMKLMFQARKAEN